MIWTHISAAVVAAFAMYVVMQLRIDAAEDAHKVVVLELREEHSAAAAKARDDAMTVQDIIVTQYQEAINESRKKEVTTRADAARARSDLASLRAQTAAAASRIRLPETAPSAVVEYALTANELFTECVGAYQELADTATGHAAAVELMRAAWPVVPDK